MKTQKLVKKLAKEMVSRKLTLSIAESCTGGQISAAITRLPGASKYFEGAIVGYANHIKHALLGVPSRVIKNEGAVSKQTAKLMALGARKNLRSDWAVAVTGLAGPAGGSKKKPVGLVFFAVAGPKFVMTQKKIFRGSRNQVQQKTVDEALSLLLKSLT